MDNMAINKNRELQELLNYIAQNPLEGNTEQMENVLHRLYRLYQDGYRHSYSTILKTIDSLEEDTAAFLALNLSLIADEYERIEQLEPKQNPELSLLIVKPSFNKLRDHVNLEIMHMAQYKKYMVQGNIAKENFDKLEKMLRTHQEKSSEIEEKEKKLNEMLEDNRSAIQQLIIQLVTVLGIFATIVVAFTGSFNLLGSAFSAIGAVSKYRLFAMVFIVGIVLYNTVFLLIYGIGKIAKVSIFEPCQHGECASGKCSRNKCFLISKAFRRVPFVFWGNAVMLICMSILTVLWFVEMYMIH